MENDNQTKFVADQLLGISAVVIALIRALEDGGALNREDLIAVIKEFREDMTPKEIRSGEGFMIERFLDALSDRKLVRFEFD